MPTLQERIATLDAEIAAATEIVRHGDRSLQTSITAKVAERDRLARAAVTSGSGPFRRVVFRNE